MEGKELVSQGKEEHDKEVLPGFEGVVWHCDINHGFNLRSYHEGAGGHAGQPT